MAETDYYKILGLSKKAADDDIKKAYRKLAMKYHPDQTKGNKAAEEKFKKISEAYAVLSDKEKRKQYDTFGSAGFQQRYTQEDIFQGFDFGNIFREFGFGSGTSFRQGGKRGGFSFNVGGEEPFGGSRFRQQQQTPVKGSDLLYELPLTIHEITTGTEKTISLNLKGGTERLTVKIPKGMITGKKLRLVGKGEKSPYGGEPGNLYIQSKVVQDSVYGIEEYDLYINHEIKLTDALLGTSISISTISGKQLNLKIPPGAKHQTKMRVKGHGIPYINEKRVGDLYVRILINIPDKLTKHQTKLVKKLAEAGL
ncbi:Integrase [Candidatus Magnetomoraceae bacterium gMMP-15]